MQFQERDPHWPLNYTRNSFISFQEKFKVKYANGGVFIGLSVTRSGFDHLQYHLLSIILQNAQLMLDKLLDKLTAIYRNSYSGAFIMFNL